jgi:hypothetical protein
VKPDETVVGPAVPHVLEAETDEDISIYNPRTEQVIVLNSTASDIWRLADGTLTLSEITARLASSYQVEADAIADDVAMTVQRFLEAGVIEEP